MQLNYDTYALEHSFTCKLQEIDPNDFISWCYEKYKAAWIAQHSNVQTILENLADFIKKNQFDTWNSEAVVERWEQTHRFNNNLWMSYDMFKNMKFRDRVYMNGLLGHAPTDLKIYDQIRKDLKGEST